MTNPSRDRHEINSGHDTMADKIVPHMVKTDVIFGPKNARLFADFDPYLFESFDGIFRIAL